LKGRINQDRIEIALPLANADRQDDMKGDFSRIRLNSAKQYTAVLKQQGRVDLDSDANEQCAIDEKLRETTSADIIGPCGGPAKGAGFGISVEGEEIWISAGRYYVEGILVEIPTRVHYDRQPYLIDPTHRAKELLESLDQAGKGSYLQFELEVWQRMATALDDPCLLEPALNQADTTTRLETIWRVVGTLEPSRIAVNLEHTGEMGAGTSGGGSGCGCQPIPAAGYQGVENQLYRVEIHQGGDLSSATFKWSRENGSVVTRVTEVNGDTVTVSSLGPDANLGYQAGQWVELSDDTNQFGPTPNQPGTLYEIASVDQANLQVTMKTPVTGVHKHRNARMRRWDQSGASATASGIPVSNTPIALENGIEVDFSRGQFQPGDYWTIPARTAKGNIEWPPCGGDGRHFQSSSFMKIYETPLACAALTVLGGDDLIERKIVVTDQRSFFTPLSATAIHVTGISWKNADLQRLDAFLYKGLDVTLDAAPTSILDAGVFRVSLEIAGLGYFRQEVDESATSKIAVSKSPLNFNAGGLETSGRTPRSFRVGAALRQEYVLDGVVDLNGPKIEGWIVNWNIPGSADRKGLAYALNSLLVTAYESTVNDDGQSNRIPAARVRVQLYGHAIFAEATRGCGAVKTIYLDGQSFGESGLLSDGSAAVVLETPSGYGARASDFESWFYLAPAPAVESVDFNPSTLTLGVGAASSATDPSTGTSKGTVTLTTPALSAVTILLTTSSQTGVTLTFSSTSITIAAGESSQTFTANVAATTEAPNGQVTFTVTATPELETTDLSRIFSAYGELYVTIDNPVAVATTSLPAGTEGKSYSTTLAATGGTPSYSWELASGSAALPEGLTLNSEGVISGTPRGSGESTITVQVTDSGSPASKDTKQLTLQVYAELKITTASLPTGNDGIPYTPFQLDASGGKTPYKWKLSAGNLPYSLAVSSVGILAGTPGEAIETTVTIEVTDSASPVNTATKNYVIEIYPTLK
jgi:hypothetical protein